MVLVDFSEMGKIILYNARKISLSVLIHAHRSERQIRPSFPINFCNTIEHLNGDKAKRLSPLLCFSHNFHIQVQDFETESSLFQDQKRIQFEASNNKVRGRGLVE